MRALIKRITPCVERRIWFTFGLFKRSLGHGPVKDYLIIQLDSVCRKKSCESSPQSSPVQSPGFVKDPTETYYGCPQCGHKKVDKLDDIKNFQFKKGQ